MKKKLIPSLNGLRAISILMVVIYHLQFSKDQIKLPILLETIFNGQLGVNIFFVISGFLITTLLIKEKDKTGSISLKGFYLRRVLRIFPAYYFLLLIYLLLQMTGILSIDKIDWIMSALYLKQFLNQGGITGHLWSLSVEEVFYLLFPLTLLLSLKYSKRNFSIFLSVLACVFIPILRIILNVRFPALVGYNIFMRGDSLILGCLLAINYETIKKYTSRLKFLPLLCCLFLIIHQLLFSYFHLHLGAIWLAFGYPGWSLFDNIAIALLIILCIENEKTVYYRILNHKWMNYIGILSYSIYLWQQLFTSEGNLWYFNRFPYNLIFIWIAAILSYNFIEKPFLSIRKKMAD